MLSVEGEGGQQPIEFITEFFIPIRNEVIKLEKVPRPRSARHPSLLA